MNSTTDPTVNAVMRAVLQLLENGIDYFTEAQAAAYLGIQPETLRKARFRGHLLGADSSPAWLRIGRNILYRRTDLAAWVEANAIENGASPQQHNAPQRTANAGGL